GVAGERLAQVLRARRAAREEPLEVGLVLGVSGRFLEVLPLARVSAPGRATAIAGLVDLAPAFCPFRLVVVGHRISTAMPQLNKIVIHKPVKATCRTPLSGWSHERSN